MCVLLCSRLEPSTLMTLDYKTYTHVKVVFTVLYQYQAVNCVVMFHLQIRCNELVLSLIPSVHLAPTSVCVCVCVWAFQAEKPNICFWQLCWHVDATKSVKQKKSKTQPGHLFCLDWIYLTWVDLLKCNRDLVQFDLCKKLSSALPESFDSSSAASLPFLSPGRRPAVSASFSGATVAVVNQHATQAHARNAGARTQRRRTHATQAHAHCYTLSLRSSFFRPFNILLLPSAIHTLAAGQPIRFYNCISTVVHRRCYYGVQCFA